MKFSKSDTFNRFNRCGVNADLEKNLHHISRCLQNKTWRPHPYTTFTVYEGKPRLIAAAPFYDRVVHHALFNILNPIFDPTLISDLYSNRVAKGTHQAMRRAQTYARAFPWVLHLDIKKYFPNIDRQILLSIIARKIKCFDTLELIWTILDINQPGLETGLPLGNQTSQFFANLYLSPADHFIKEELKIAGYLRYVDDLWIFGESPDALWQYKKVLAAFLGDQLKLEIKPNGSNLYAVKNGFPCLGYRVFPQTVVMPRAAILKFRRRMISMQCAYTQQRQEMAKIRASLMGTLGHFQQADTKNLQKHLLYETAFNREVSNFTGKPGVDP